VAARDGVLNISFIAIAPGDVQASGDVPVDFGLTPSLANAAIIDAAKAAQVAQNGQVFSPSDKVMLFGGVN
jgi:hypothetical protein